MAFDVKMMFGIWGGVQDWYLNDPKFSDGWVLANSADPDQTAPLGAV